MIKFIHAADIHLDSPLRKLNAYEGVPLEELRHATSRAFENLLNLALEEGVNFVLIAGDLYDSDWRDYNTGLCLVSQLRKLQEVEADDETISSENQRVGDCFAAHAMTVLQLFV